MRTLSEYQAMTPAQLLEEPDAPESLRIKAQIAIENERAERYAYERAAQEGTEADMQRTGW